MSNFLTPSHTSRRGIYFTSDGANLDEAVSIIQSEWRRLCESVSAEEVEKAKRMLQTNLVLQLDGSTPVCEELGRHMLCYGRRIPIEELLARVEVSLSSVKGQKKF